MGEGDSMCGYDDNPKRVRELGCEKLIPYLAKPLPVTGNFRE